MKLTGPSVLAATILLALTACGGGNTDSEDNKPSFAHSDEAAQPAGSQAGETPDTAPQDAMKVAPTTDGQSPADAALPQESPAAEPPASFAQCRSCHSVETGKNGVGPSLAGVFGKPAASLPDFRYSPALQSSGITWTRDKLDEWLSGPSKMVPGTRMVQAVRNDGQRKEVIDYLETLK